MTVDVKFIDSGREPKCPSDPAFPAGKDVSIAAPGQKSCCFNVPYPAPRCGVYVVVCSECDYRLAMTVAGRPDDPRTVTMPCKVVLCPTKGEE